MSKKADKPSKGAAGGDPKAVRLSAHPRAVASIRRARGWSGLLGFAGVTVLALRAGLPLPDALLRGLGAGAAAQFAGWFIAIKLWRQVALAELAAARERHERRIEELRRRAADAAAAHLAADAAEHAAMLDRG